MTDINIAVVPVAGLGTRLLPATKSQPKEMLPVGRKPVVQYVVEELTRMKMKRVLFITGPGKTSIENHFDLNEELIQELRESGKEELLEELEYERAPLQYFYTRQRELLGLGPRHPMRRAVCGEPAVRHRPGRFHHRHARQERHRAADDPVLSSKSRRRPSSPSRRCPWRKCTATASPSRKHEGDTFEIEDLIEKPSRAGSSQQPGHRRALCFRARDL